MLSFETKYWQRGILRVAGVDEAGRGPLAGPVVAAAVVLDAEWMVSPEAGACLQGLNDSKQLSEKTRLRFFDLLQASPHAEIGVGRAAVEEIDRLNILRATHLAMARALRALAPPSEVALVDGCPVRGLPCASEAIVKGDTLSFSIAAASIVAKVTRDAQMLTLHALYPVYGFDCNKGYGTQTHLQALYEHGACPEHRRSCGPVRESLRNREGGLTQQMLFDSSDGRDNRG